MTNKERAGQAFSILREVITAEVVAAGSAGLRNSDVAQRLDLQTGYKGQHRNHLTHGILNELVADGTLVRRAEGRAIYYQLP